MYVLIVLLLISYQNVSLTIPSDEQVITIMFKPIIKHETCTFKDDVKSCYVEPGSYITTPFSLLLGFTIIAIVLYLDYRVDGKIDGSFKKLEKR